MLAEAAGARALGAASGGPTAPDPVVTDLQIAYLSLGRVGPVVSLGAGAGGGRRRRRPAVVELRDAGADGRLMTVANVVAAPAAALDGPGCPT